jgi:hypothetical protein
VLAESQPLFTFRPVAIKSMPPASLVTSQHGRSSNSSRGGASLLAERAD